MKSLLIAALLCLAVIASARDQGQITEERIRNRGVFIIQHVQVTNNTQSEQSLALFAGQKIELPQICKSKLTKDELVALAEDANKFVSSWIQASQNNSAVYACLPTLNASQFATFYAAITNNITADANTFSAEEAQTRQQDLLTAATFGDDNRKTLSWLEFWVYMCNDGIQPASHDYLGEESNDEQRGKRIQDCGKWIAAHQAFEASQNNSSNNTNATNGTNGTNATDGNATANGTNGTAANGTNGTDNATAAAPAAGGAAPAADAAKPADGAKPAEGAADAAKPAEGAAPAADAKKRHRYHANKKSSEHSHSHKQNQQQQHHKHNKRN